VLLLQLVGQPVRVPLHAYAPQPAPLGELPAAAATHMPSIPVRLQRSHTLPQAPSQHVLSTQKPLVHSLLIEQLPPLLFLSMQVPEQK